jgi:hypothetical protein
MADMSIGGGGAGTVGGAGTGGSGGMYAGLYKLTGRLDGAGDGAVLVEGWEAREAAATERACKRRRSVARLASTAWFRRGDPESIRPGKAGVLAILRRCCCLGTLSCTVNLRTAPG